MAWLTAVPGVCSAPGPLSLFRGMAVMSGRLKLSEKGTDLGLRVAPLAADRPAEPELPGPGPFADGARVNAEHACYL